MKILASSDIHLPYFIKEFDDSIRKINEDIDLIILCGDIVDNYQHIYVKKLYYLLRQKFGDKKILATFGNNELSININDDRINIYKKEYNFINWLNYEKFEYNNYIFYGFMGFPDRTWRNPDISNIKKYYLEKIEEFLKNENNNIILFSHYGLSRYTTFGGPAPEWALYSKDLENLILKYKDKIRLALHGHVHKAINYYKKIDNLEIYNVAFPIHKKPLIIEI